MKIHGLTAPGFEAVRDAFGENFVNRHEAGAAFSAVWDGEVVVDLWGGCSDWASGREWTRDTLQVVFSGTKGLTALCLLMLVDRGQLDPESPVSRYWPEFAAADKEGVLVRDIASHQARLPGIRARLAEADILDGEKMAALLAAQRQESDPRARSVYHALTYGWLCGELIRRIDGRSPGRFFADEVAKPLELEIWIGLPADLEQRVSTLHYGSDWDAALFGSPETSDELLACTWWNPPIFPSDHIEWNTPAFHLAEIPAAGGIASARSLARLYGCLARGGEVDGIRLVSTNALELGRSCLTRRTDPFTDEPAAFGFGFELQTDRQTLGPPPNAFGHCGAGGSAHGAWPDQRVGFSYAMNEMRAYPDNADPRTQALLDALYESVVRLPRGAGRSTRDAACGASGEATASRPDDTTTATLATLSDSDLFG